jgi:hypothetical protein
MFLLLTISSALTAGIQPSSAAPRQLPTWAQQDWEYWTHGSGRWVADNKAYRSENEPFDTYGMEWEWGLGKKTLRGRLFALKGGEEVRTLWQFLSYWHPGEERLVVNQWGGDGTFGTGTQRRTDENATESLERFFAPDGGSFRAGHRTRKLTGEAHVQSYDIAADDVWEERRAYVWKRVEAPPSAE